MRLKFRLLPLGLVLGLAAACAGYAAAAPAEIDAPDDAAVSASARAQTHADDEDQTYIIGAQNLIQIKIFGEADANQTYRVDEMGYIKHALLGRVKLGGLTLDEAERLLEKKLGGDYYVNPKVTIFILEHSIFSILGEVRRPGNYELNGRVSIIKAISLAGGFTPVANQRSVKIIRKMEGVETSFDVDTTRITGRGDLSAQVFLEADDVVVVSKSFF